MALASVESARRAQDFPRAGRVQGAGYALRPLQQPSGQHILSACDLFEWVDKNVEGIKALYVSSDDIDIWKPKLNVHFKKSKTIEGSRSHHCFIPISESELLISRLSMPKFRVPKKVNLQKRKTKSCAKNIIPKPGTYVAAVYESRWYIGSVVQTVDDGEILVNIMTPDGKAKSYMWPKHVDECWIPSTDVLMQVPVPKIITGRQYTLPDCTVTAIEKAWNAYHQA